MALSIYNSVAYEIEQALGSAGDRIFVQDARAFILDGILFGNGGNAIFSMNSVAYVIEGQPYSAGTIVPQHSCFVIEQRPPADVVIQQFTGFVIEGPPGPDRTALKRHGAFMIEVI